MSENNQMMSVEGQIVGMPLAGPESFSQQQLDYLKRALGVDETVLWTGTIGGTGGSNLNTTITLSEAITNFDRIRIYISNIFSLCEISSAYPKAKHIQDENPSSNAFIGYYIHCDNSTHLTYQCGFKTSFQGAYAGEYWGYGAPYKIVGIHRISGGNT